MKSRRAIFGNWHISSQAFRQAAAATPQAAHLNNPSGSQPFLYLTDYLSELSQDWWQLPAQELQVLDWGCGLGQVSFLLKEKGFQPISADLPDYPCRVFLEQAGLDMVPLGHQWELPFESESFHLVTSFGVLEHVLDERASLQEIRRVLKPGGLFFCVNLPRYFSWTQRIAHLQGNFYHNRLYRRRDVRKLLKEVDFGILEMWRRQIFPKNRVSYFKPDWLEHLDQFLCERTPLGWLSTCLEFVAYKH